MQPNKSESSVTGDIIKKIHLTLADPRTGNTVLEFLKSTEPEFMDEVHRFMRTEIARLRYSLSENQSLYIGSVIAASYISGFLIAREATHNMFNKLVPFDSDIKKALSPEQIDKIIDDNLDKNKSYKEIAKIIRSMMTGEAPKKAPKKRSREDTSRGDHLNIGNLD